MVAADFERAVGLPAVLLGPGILGLEILQQRLLVGEVEAADRRQSRLIGGLHALAIFLDLSEHGGVGRRSRLERIVGGEALEKNVIDPSHEAVRGGVELALVGRACVDLPGPPGFPTGLADDEHGERGHRAEHHHADREACTTPPRERSLLGHSRISRGVVNVI
ncbi:MAG: hypothetical protein M5U32_21945 [Myxococcota bacterium]|nr:hypothetical protein [Myxococcota bacterium]